MTTELLAISKVTIGGGDAFPVLSLRQRHAWTGPADQATEAIEEITWDLTCLAKASGPTTIRSFNDALRAALCGRAKAVVLTELGESTTLAVADCLPGFPAVELVAVPEISHGPWQAFELSITARKYKAVSNLVSHEYERTTTIDAEGKTEITQRGEVRTATGTVAATWTGTNVLTPASTAAGTANQSFTQRVTTNADAAWCRYEYTSSDSQTGGIGSVSEASVEDRTVEDQEGRVTRTVSGYAVGSGATTFAQAQALTQGTNLMLLRQEGPTPPSVPGNQVRFRYEYISGVTDARFPGIYVVSLEETVEQVGGGQPIVSTTYLGGTPVIRRGPAQPFVYRQSSTIAYLGGDFDDHGLTPLFDADNQDGIDLPRRQLNGRLRTVSIDRTFVFTAAVDPLPEPRSLEALP